jgi:hypothetical protein
VRGVSSFLSSALILSIVAKGGIPIIITGYDTPTLVNLLGTVDWSTLAPDPHGLFITLTLHTSTLTTPNAEDITTIIGGSL